MSAGAAEKCFLIGHPSSRPRRRRPPKLKPSPGTCHLVRDASCIASGSTPASAAATRLSATLDDTAIGARSPERTCSYCPLFGHFDIPTDARELYHGRRVRTITQ